MSNTDKAFSQGVQSLLGDDLPGILTKLETGLLDIRESIPEKDGIYWIELMTRYLQLIVKNKLEETNTKFSNRKHAISAIRVASFLDKETKKSLGIKMNYLSNRTSLTKTRIFCAQYDCPNEQKDEVETLWDLARNIFDAKNLKLNLSFLHSALPGRLKEKYSKIYLSYEDMAVVGEWLDEYDCPNEQKDGVETLWDLARKLFDAKNLKLNLAVLHSALPGGLKDKYSKISLSYEDMAVVGEWLDEYDCPNEQKDGVETLWDLARNLFDAKNLKLNLSFLHSALPGRLKEKYSKIYLSYEDMAVVGEWLDEYDCPNEQKDGVETLWDLVRNLFDAKNLKLNLSVLHSALPGGLKDKYSKISLSYEDMVVVSEWLSGYQFNGQKPSTLDLTREFLETSKDFFIAPKTIWSAIPSSMKSNVVWVDVTASEAKKALEVA